MLTKLCSLVIPTPLPDAPKKTFLYRIAKSKPLQWMLVAALLLQTAAGVIDLFMYINDINYHIIFFIFSINFTVFFTAEMTVKVSILLGVI